MKDNPVTLEKRFDRVYLLRKKFRPCEKLPNYFSLQKLNYHLIIIIILVN